MWEGFIAGVTAAFAFVNAATFVGLWIMWCALVAGTIVKVNEGKIDKEFALVRLGTIFGIGIALWVLFPHYPTPTPSLRVSFIQ